MQGIQKIRVRTEDIEKRTENIEQRTEKTDENVDNIYRMMMKYEDRFKKIEEQDIQRDKKIGDVDTRLSVVEKDKSGSLGWEIDKSEFYLRFQNIEEEKGENLAGIMIEILAEALEITKEKMMDGMHEVFHVYTRYAMRNKLPREIHIRFTKKTIKTQILQVAREKTLKYKAKEIVVLKQVPRRVREMRREYQFLTKALLKKGVNYRWLIPEGLMFIWQEQRHRINSVEKAELFYLEYFRGKEEETRKEESLIEFQKECLTTTEKEEGALGSEPREQREPRSTQAINPSYKV
uniref:L1 transposable element RRM domain-containing protein n=1 Tax=Laticauda laticaudata TaxID=8630 RepID=A0A8C5T3D8_LATLA